MKIKNFALNKKVLKFKMILKNKNQKLTLEQQVYYPQDLGVNQKTQKIGLEIFPNKSVIFLNR